MTKENVEEEKLGEGKWEEEREKGTQEGGEPDRSPLGGQGAQMGGLGGQESVSRMGHRPQVGDGQLFGDGMCSSVQRLRKDQVVWRKERNENI